MFRKIDSFFHEMENHMTAKKWGSQVHREKNHWLEPWQALRTVYDRLYTLYRLYTIYGCTEDGLINIALLHFALWGNFYILSGRLGLGGAN